MTQFHEVLKSFLKNDSLKQKGLPSVNSLAAQLSLSSRQLSNLLKQETGQTAINLIRIALMSEAKN